MLVPMLMLMQPNLAVHYDFVISLLVAFVRIAVRAIFADIQHFVWYVCRVEAKTSAFVLVRHSNTDAIAVDAVFLM